MEILILVFVAGAVIAAIMGVIGIVKRDKLMIAARLDEFAQESSNLYLPPELDMSFKDRVFKPVLDYFMSFSSKMLPKDKKDAYETKLMAAGYPLGLTAESFVLFKYGVLVFTVLLGIITADPLMIVILILVGLPFPAYC